MLINIEDDANVEAIHFELFCRLVATYLELANNPKLFASQEKVMESRETDERIEDYDEEEDMY